MADRSFPEAPRLPWPPAPVVERIVRREPLAAIEEILGISIHDLVNDPELKPLVLDFYRISRRVESESWLRRALEDQAAERWIASHL